MVEKTFIACVFVITVRLKKFLVALKLSINVLKVPSSQLQSFHVLEIQLPSETQARNFLKCYLRVYEIVGLMV